jgi:hypothetical protein
MAQPPARHRTRPDRPWDNCRRCGATLSDAWWDEEMSAFRCARCAAPVLRWRLPGWALIIIAAELIVLLLGVFVLAWDTSYGVPAGSMESGAMSLAIGISVVLPGLVVLRRAASRRAPPWVFALLGLILVMLIIQAGAVAWLQTLGNWPGHPTDLVTYWGRATFIVALGGTTLLYWGTRRVPDPFA